MCHWDHLTKCYEKYLVTWASVGGSNIWWGGSSALCTPPRWLRGCCGAYGARHGRVRPSVMQYVLAVRGTVVIKPSRLNIVAQGLSNSLP